MSGDRKGAGFVYICVGRGILCNFVRSEGARKLPVWRLRGFCA
ncbi:hypothetical protein BACCOPRO_01824 [Phocaeicola coprophilus DSM 18228 = JCM 13818]|uniref:Uncharacterized protein n=1 Tax=Phocaeicola coprophilus DSM 18228 = JCM 13818 TaxID=547042 RepID=S0F7H2_9BACT|nr:hypothetical protein BACCOPRO_01824 [Phocaeicola coprophilus DSM 18228 = JCM 13818]